MREPRSAEEVARFLEAAPSIKYRAALSVAYGAGLRVSEVVSLKVSDVDSERMMLRVEQGKGRKDRHAMLSPVLLDLLRDWYRVARPQGWLFPGQNPWGGVGFPIPPAGQPDDDAPPHARLPRRGPHGGDHQARVAAHLAP
jgi:integrase